MAGPLLVVHGASGGRVVVTDSLTYCDGRTSGRDVVVSGSFAGRLALGFALEWGVRAVIAHAAGVGKDSAGIAGLALADGRGVPAAAVETMSARLGDGMSVWHDGAIEHANESCRALGIEPGTRADSAALMMLAAPPGCHAPAPGVVDRSQHVVESAGGIRIVLTGSTRFASSANASDVLCVGSHGGLVNALPLEAIRPRGVIFNDGGRARDDSGLGALPLLDRWGVAAATVDTMSARIGDPESSWATGLVSGVNAAAAAAGVAVGQTACQAARLMAARPFPGHARIG